MGFENLFSEKRLRHLSGIHSQTQVPDNAFTLASLAFEDGISRYAHLKYGRTEPELVCLMALS